MSFPRFLLEIMQIGYVSDSLETLVRAEGLQFHWTQ